jgi:hypothetical protein
MKNNKNKSDDKQVKTALLNQIVNETSEIRQDYRNKCKKIIKVNFKILIICNVLF